MEALSDQELTERIQAGDSNAEAAFYRRFYPPVRLLLDRRTGGSAEAQDLAHDALIIVLKKLRSEGLEDGRKLPAYVQQTAKYVYIARVREAASRKTYTSPEIPEYAMDAIKDELDTVLEQESAQFVRTVLGELAQERDRQILIQHYVQELPKVVICENLGLSALQYDKVIHTARKRFRSLVEASIANREGLADGV